MTKQELALAMYLADTVCKSSILQSGITIEEACVMFSEDERAAYEAKAEKVMLFLPKETPKQKREVKLTRKTATAEWVVVVWVDGKRVEENCYYTIDKQDAIDTMGEMIRTEGYTERK